MYWFRVLLLLPSFSFHLAWSQSPAMELGCYGEAIEVGQLCINYVSKEKLSFDQATRKCIAMSSNLALPQTAKDTAELANFTDETIWVSMSDQHGKSEFVLPNGVLVADEFFANWQDNSQPISTSIGGCVVMNEQSGKFRAERCVQEYHFACVIPKMTCPYPFMSVGNLCLRTLSDASETFNASRTACKDISGFLGIPSSDAQQLLLNEYRKFKSFGSWSWLLGIHRSSTGQYVRTHDGTEVSFLPKWVQNEPSNDGSCIEDYFYSEWINDLPCDGSRNYFCQTNGKPYLPKIKNGKVIFNVTDGVSEVICSDNFYLKGNRKPKFGKWTAKWDASFPPICTATHNSGQTSMRVKKRYGVNPSKLLPVQKFDSQTLMNCPWVCKDDQRCVATVFDKSSFQCRIYDRDIGHSDIIEKDDLVLFQYLI